MVRRTQSPIRDFLVFAGVYLGARVVSALSLSAWVRYLGASKSGAELVLADNELIIQVISLLVAFFAVNRGRGVSSRFAWFQGLWPRAHMGAEITAQWISVGALRGFWVASFLVSASLFLGFSSVEWPNLSWAWLWNIAPLMALEATVLIVWVLLFEKTLRFLSDCLSRGGAERRWEGELLTLVVGAHLLFRLLNGSPHLFDRVFTALFCALVSGSYLLWIESSTKLHGSADRGAWLRISSVGGFLLSWAHLYGQVLGGTRSLSLLALFDGPVLEPTGSLAHAGLVGECVVLLGCIAGINLLLRRVLTPDRDAR